MNGLPGGGDESGVSGGPSSTAPTGTWAAMAESPEPEAAVRRHLSFLARSPECERLLDALMTSFVRARSTGDSLELVFQYAEYDDEEAVIDLGRPYGGDTGAAPASVSAVARVHNGVSWESLGGGWFGFSGFTGGAFSGAGGWESRALTETSRNKALLEELEAAGLGPDDVRGAFDYGQNWLIWHPVRRNTLGEPALYFVSHEDCVAVEVPGAADLTYGQILLRLMAQTILGEDVFEEIYT